MRPHRSATAHFVVVGDLATLVWLANLAVLELHVPQWTVGPRGARHSPDLLIFDLDPGPPATVVECCRVAERILAVLAADGLTGYPKTSGGKGLQVYATVRVCDPDRTLELRPGGGRAARRADPVPSDLVFTVPEVLTRVQRTGDLWTGPGNQDHRFTVGIEPGLLQVSDPTMALMSRFDASSLSNLLTSSTVGVPLRYERAAGGSSLYRVHSTSHRRHRAARHCARTAAAAARC